LSFLEVTQLSKFYQKGAQSIRALDEVSFSVKPGEFMAIVGRSGSGKSTLLNLLGGLDTATKGRIHFLDQEMIRMSRTELDKHRRFSVGIVFQSFNLISWRSALENVALALAFGGVSRKMRQDRAAELLTQVGLGERLDHKPPELSGGEAQRVAIARALANNPRLLLADEPTGNLDSATAREVTDLLQKISREQNLTVIMVTHELEIARSVSHSLIQLLDGRIIHREVLREMVP
jgi:putative ABC transport system ATP-binding protein